MYVCKLLNPRYFVDGEMAAYQPGMLLEQSLHYIVIYKYIILSFCNTLTLSILYLLVSEIGRPFALLQIKSTIVVNNTHRAKIMIVNTTY